ncbi:hypothetical protein CERSUDRAFT_101386 [Gelatoporia subvermispora B]|uniref:Uncharacterized protein n=1 Tax=Ceriporiopsis subvermispora (strain B) TaxID=914234 RepID=M2Q0U7_CERS8|nr:hypothetical protein CERSUDRAFT_101386 [Gelatoporia subvermispora B]
MSRHCPISLARRRFPVLQIPPRAGRRCRARLQREALVNYPIGLIRAVMFHPSANRLAGFLEVSALMIALARSGGAQYKAGLLRIDAVGNKGSFGRRATRWGEPKRQKWCSVRESYLDVHEEMGELAVRDVFLIDQDFKIERPTRYYRQGLNMFRQLELEEDGEEHERENEHEHGQGRDPRRGSMDSSKHHYVASIKSRVSKIARAHGHARNGSAKADTEGQQPQQHEAHHRRSSR